MRGILMIGARGCCAVVCSVLLVACAKPGDSTTPSASGSPDDAVTSDTLTPVGGDLRLGTTWYLVGGGLEPIAEPERVTLTFEADTLGGRAPVNSFSGPYTASPDGSISVDALASTRMAGPESDMVAEQEFLALLQDTDGYTAVEGGDLYLFRAAETVLVFSAHPQPIDGPSVSGETTALATAIIGVTEQDARTTVEAANHTFRVVSRDGEALVVTEDYSTTRINATVVDDVVTDTYIG